MVREDPGTHLLTDSECAKLVHPAPSQAFPCCSELDPPQRQFCYSLVQAYGSQAPPAGERLPIHLGSAQPGSLKHRWQIRVTLTITREGIVVIQCVP